MSSPYIPLRGDSPDRGLASSPVGGTMMNALDLQQPSIRPMRLKVLYTFDTDNKTNCLARWPQILNIRTAYLDEQTQIGVIELRTCIQAIVDASPEILSKLDQDYTVYAYDYSEYDTPQVGQGMLSRVLASASTTPSAPAHQSDTVVTGRVCKSMLGLFANGIQETLEVKLRLVPVPNSLQSEYIESMKHQREHGQGVPEGVDPRAWNEFIKNNPGMMAVVNPSRSHTPTGSFSQPTHGLEQVQRLMSEGYRPQSARPQSAPRRGSYAGSAMSGNASNRSGSPTPSLQSLATTQPIMRTARPISRMSNEGSQSGEQRMPALTPGELVYEERVEDGPARKRAKVMKADHPGRSSLGKTFDTLRATASTAASIRVLQPTAVRPTADAIRSLEAPPRVPTPTPGANLSGRRLTNQPAKSSLGREVTLTSDSGYRSMYSEDGVRLSESAVSSPDNAGLMSDYNSPEEPASSPPMIRPPSVAPTSPMLPAMPYQPIVFQHQDLDDLFGGPQDSMDPWMEEEQPAPSETCAGSEVPLEFQHYVPVVAPPQGRKTQAQLEEEAAAEAKRRAISHKNARRAIGFNRTQTWSGGEDSSDPPAPPPRKLARAASTSKVDAERPRSRTSNKWNKEKRRQAMQSKLQASIAAGQMPPYCENCGAIETPTWRKAFSRIYSGDHSHLRTSDAEGGIICIQVTETNDDGSTKLFKIYKKSISQEDEGFSEVLLCNPCGIWLSNHKRMRPETHWDKEGKSKKRKSRGKKKEEDTDPSEAANALSDGGALPSDATFAFGGDAAHNDAPTMGGAPPKASMPPPKETKSTEPASDPGLVLDSGINPAAFAALQRAIQSSPGRFLGSRTSPIQIDKNSPNPARRSLFSSPKSGGPLGVDLKEKKGSATKTGLPPKTPNEIRLSVPDEEAADKENQPPQPVEIDDLDTLFSDLPMTPSKRRGALLGVSPSAIFKTPAPKGSPLKTALATGDFFSSAAKAFLHAPRTPSQKTPTSKAAAAVELTPFTRHLNQLLSEPNIDSPSRFLSDITHLPYPPDGMPSMTDGGTPSKMFRSGDFDFSDFPSSDGPMPSSPPGWFGVYEDPIEHGHPWDLGFGSSPVKKRIAEEKENDEEREKEKKEQVAPRRGEARTAATVGIAATVTGPVVV